MLTLGAVEKSIIVLFLFLYRSLSQSSGISLRCYFVACSKKTRELDHGKERPMWTTCVNFIAKLKRSCHEPALITVHMLNKNFALNYHEVVNWLSLFYFLLL